MIVKIELQQGETRACFEYDEEIGFTPNDVVNALKGLIHEPEEPVASAYQNRFSCDLCGKSENGCKCVEPGTAVKADDSGMIESAKAKAICPKCGGFMLYDDEADDYQCFDCDYVFVMVEPPFFTYNSKIQADAGGDIRGYFLETVAKVKESIEAEEISHLRRCPVCKRDMPFIDADEYIPNELDDVPNPAAMADDLITGRILGRGRSVELRGLMEQFYSEGYSTGYWDFPKSFDGVYKLWLADPKGFEKNKSKD